MIESEKFCFGFELEMSAEALFTSLLKLALLCVNKFFQIPMGPFWCPITC